MKSFKLFLCTFMLISASLASCTDKEVPSPSLPSSPTDNNQMNARGEEEPILIRGHVKNGSGDIISGALVDLYVSGQGTAVRSVTSDSTGQYSMSGLAQGNYDLKLQASGYQAKLISFSLSAEMTRTDTLFTQ